MPLLTGASIAGALRNYLREYQVGFGVAENRYADSKERLLAERLFGHLIGYDASVESWLMIDDALGKLPTSNFPVEIRDGVTIDPVTRTAEEKKKYDIELLTAGTIFPLRFEFWLPGRYAKLERSAAIASVFLSLARFRNRSNRTRDAQTARVWSVPGNRVEALALSIPKE